MKGTETTDILANDRSCAERCDPDRNTRDFSSRKNAGSLIIVMKHRLRSLSFKSGVVVGTVCLICYFISFAQMLLPLSLEAKGMLWLIFFGAAKICQYSALLILGKAGVQKLRKLSLRTRSLKFRCRSKRHS